MIFLFQSDKNYCCYGNLYVQWTYNWKSGIYIIFPVSMGVFGFFLEMFILSSPLHYIRLFSKSLNLIGCQDHKNVFLLL